MHVIQPKQAATQKRIPEMIRGHVRHFEEVPYIVLGTALCCRGCYM